jgi:hypothetical protein
MSIYIFPCMYVHIQKKYTNLSSYTDMHTRIYTYIYVAYNFITVSIMNHFLIVMYINIYIHIHKYIHTYKYTYVYSYKGTHIHMYMAYHFITGGIMNHCLIDRGPGKRPVFDYYSMIFILHQHLFPLKIGIIRPIYHTYIFIYIYIYTYIYIYIYIYLYIYVHIYIYIYIYINP